VQSVHAGIEAARQYLTADADHPHLVVCSIGSEEKLLAAADRLSLKDVRYALFREPDRNNEVTALATEPLADDRRRLLERYRCLSHRDFLAAGDVVHEPGG
jgi:hypothetical protein